MLNQIRLLIIPDHKSKVEPFLGNDKTNILFI